MAPQLGAGLHPTAPAAGPTAPNGRPRGPDRTQRSTTRAESHPTVDSGCAAAHIRAGLLTTVNIGCAAARIRARPRTTAAIPHPTPPRGPPARFTPQDPACPSAARLVRRASSRRALNAVMCVVGSGRARMCTIRVEFDAASADRGWDVTPPLVQRAYALAEQTGFGTEDGGPSSCLPEVGRLLAVLAASRRGGRLAELGTDVGAGAGQARRCFRDERLMSVKCARPSTPLRSWPSGMCRRDAVIRTGAG
jgi:hypothetical protein